MRTAVVSDLHLGSNSEIDLLRDRSIRNALLREISSADRLVLLGDVFEFFERPLSAVMTSAEPVLRELGEAMAGREVVLVPGNHDHRLAEPLLDRLALQGDQIELEHFWKPSSAAELLIAAWLGETHLTYAYPGIWLRGDVYATHGHYIDCHRQLPRAECLAAAATLRALGPLPSQATPADYERVLRPGYGLGYAVAQAGLGALAIGPASRTWRTLATGKDTGASLPRKAFRAAARATWSTGTWAANGLLRASFQTNLSSAAIYGSGVEACAEMVKRLQLRAEHLIVGHTHWAGPADGEHIGQLPDGCHLHNAGSWVAPSLPEDPHFSHGSNSPGTLIWLTDHGAPECHRLLNRFPLPQGRAKPA